MRNPTKTFFHPNRELVENQISIRTQIIEDYAIAYEQTGNPVYVWLAINSAWLVSDLKAALSGDADHQPGSMEATMLPSWCLTYLIRVASEVQSICHHMVTSPTQFSGPDTLSRLPMVLAFARRGWNAFTQYLRDQTKEANGWAYVSARRAGLSHEEAIAKVEEQLGRMIDERTLRRHIALLRRRGT